MSVVTPQFERSWTQVSAFLTIQQRPLFPHREELLMDLGFGATSKRPFIGWNFGCEPGDFPGLPHWGIILFDRETR